MFLEIEGALMKPRPPETRAHKKVIVYTDGDSSLIRSWSNVPFLFTRALQDSGFDVVRVNIKAPWRFHLLYHYTVRPILRLLGASEFCDYSRSWIHDAWVQSKAKRAGRDNPDAIAHIFLSFSHAFRARRGPPTLMFCDWSIAYLFERLLQREPGFWERLAIRRQHRTMSYAKAVVTLFPEVAKHARSRIDRASVYYLGNVINSVREPIEAAVRLAKKNSQEILFIGSKKYLQGAKDLILAMKEIQACRPDLALRLCIIGMRPDEIDFALPPFVTCLGYLDKGDPDSCDTYYERLKVAKVVVNTTAGWGAFSSTLEAMHWFCPVITTPYDDFVATFGSSIAFGAYCRAGAPEQLASSLLEIILSPSYEEYCLAANRASQPFTWGAFTNKFINVMNEYAS